MQFPRAGEALGSGSEKNRTMSTYTLPRLLLAATAASFFASVLGAAWLLHPADSFFHAKQTATLIAALTSGDTATRVFLITALGALAAGAASLCGALGRRGTMACAALLTLVLGAGFGSSATLTSAGYLLALCMPLLLVGLLVQVIRRYPAARWTFGVPALVLLAGAAVLGREALGNLATTFVAQLAGQGANLFGPLLLLLLALLWAAVTIRCARGTEFVARATSWVTRHRRVFTIIAACGPLPYALARLTWFTPWPIFGGDAAADPATRIWGITLSSGAWLGAVLTVGLLRPWGENFPRWVPWLAGRPVPVMAAALPAGAVAAMLCFTAVPLLVQAAASERSFLMALVFPCWLWGPALALAAWGYVGHRRITGPSGIIRTPAPSPHSGS